MIVLTIGVLVIAGGVYLLFISSDNASPFMANIVFSIGFLFYVIYTAMTTSSLQNTIREQEVVIGNLKEEVKRKTTENNGLSADIAKLKNDLQSAISKLEATEKEHAESKAMVADLEGQMAKAKEKLKNSEQP